MKPLAILGGTFDPVHLGHLNAAWEAAELLDAEVHLMPASVPPHRPPPVASAEQRVALLAAALQGQSRLVLDTLELERHGPSYSVDTLTELRAREGVRPLVMLIGEDAFASLTSWHRWHALFELAHLGVLTRPGIEPSWPSMLRDVVDARLVDDPAVLHREPAGRVIALPVTPLDISATRVREMLGTGREPRYLLPAGVFDAPVLLEPYRRHR